MRNRIFSLAAASIGGTIVKLSKMAICGYLDKEISSFSVSDRSGHVVYGIIHRWISEFISIKRANHRVLSRVSHSRDFSPVVVMSPANGMYRCKYSGLNLLIYITNNKSDDAHGRDENTIKIIATNDRYGRLLKIVEGLIKSELPTDSIQVDINDYTVTRPSRPMANVIMDHTEKDSLISHLDFWKKSEELYTSLGITYKTGILLEGPPGTGKTSMARAIATYLGMPLVVTNTLNIGHKSAGNSVYLIEDIDRDIVKSQYNKARTQVVKRNDDDDDDDDSKGELFNISEFMNHLDGIASPPNSVFIISTNHVEKLDSAMLRPGRIDIRIHMGYFTHSMACEMCRLYGVDEKHIESIEEEVWKKPSSLSYELLRIKKCHKT